MSAFCAACSRCIAKRTMFLRRAQSVCMTQLQCGPAPSCEATTLSPRPTCGSQVTRVRCQAVHSPDKRPPTTPSPVQPDFSIDDLFLGLPSSSPHEGQPPIQQQQITAAPLPRTRRSRQRSISGPEAEKNSHTAKRNSNSSSSSQAANESIAPSHATSRLARMLRSGRSAAANKPEATDQQQRQQADTEQPPLVEQPPIAPSTAFLEIPPPSQPTPSAMQGLQPQDADLQPVPVTQPSMLEESAPLKPTDSMADTNGIVPSPDTSHGDEMYGALQTTHRRRSRLFSLNTPVAVPPLSSSNRPGLRSTFGAGKAGASTGGSNASEGLQGQGLVASTRTALRRRQGRQATHTSTSSSQLSALAPQPSMAMQLDSRRHDAAGENISQRSSFNSSAPLAETPSQQSAPSRSKPSPPLSAFLSGQQGSPQASNQQQAALHTGAAGASGTVELEAARGARPVTLRTWVTVVAEGWPLLFSPGYHTCLYEFLFDLWAEVGKDAARGRHSSVQQAFDLLSRCWASPDVLVRHTAVLSLAECLADSEALAECAPSNIQPQAMLCEALIPLVRWLHPDELQPDGALHRFHEAACRECGCPVQAHNGRQATAALAATQAGGPPAPARRRGRPPKRPSVANPAGNDSGSGGCALEWQQLMQRLQAQRVAYPAISVAPLISLEDTTWIE